MKAILASIVIEIWNMELLVQSSVVSASRTPLDVVVFSDRVWRDFIWVQ